MAGKIDETVKRRLQAAGQWKAFLERRDELKAEGHSPDDARMTALGELLPKCDDDNTLGGALPVAPAALAGRTANEPEVARWVARNIDNPDASSQDCPDPFAWTLLRMCRDNPAFALMFVKDIWTKLLVSEAKREDTGASVGEIDGTPTLKLIERIRAISKKCKESDSA